MPHEPLALVLERLTSIDGRLPTLEQKVDARLQETRPIWERALAEISETRSELGQVAADVKEIKRNQRALSDSMLSMRGEIREIDDRLGKIEPKAS